MNSLLRIGVISGLLCFLSLLANAQNVTETQWYFGNSIENFVIDRSGRTANLETNQATPFGMGGSAVVVDQDKGNLLFYSDGQLVYDATHTLLPAVAGGTLLSGDPTINQPVVACPFPDGSNQYFFFTNDGVEIQYTLVDASIQGNGTIPQFPRGDIASANQPFGLTDPSEGMTIIESFDQERFWLITQDRTTFDFKVTEIDNFGVGATTFFDVFPGTVPSFEAVQFAVLNDSAIAVAPKGPNRNVMIMDFDNQTGTLSYNRSVQNTGFGDTGSTVIYDVEWSNDGSKLYVSRTGDGTNPGGIYQVNLTDSVNVPIPVNPVLTYPMHSSYGLKRGIDGRIYHLYQLNDASSPFQLGRISRPDSTVATGVFYDSLVFDVDFNGRQFPQFAPSFIPPDYFTMDFVYFDTCAFSTTKFAAIVDPIPQNFSWTFGDGGAGFGPAPIYEYLNTGSYNVTLNVESDGITQSFSRFLTISQTDSVDLGNDTTICVDEILTLDPQVNAVSYIWSTGETTQTIDVDTAGTYWVEITTASGCTAFDDIVVTEYGVVSSVYNQWYFGEMAGLDFNTGAPVPINDANMMFSPEGCATVSDENGQLLFYTNGSTVWNKEHGIMVNGDSIGGDSTSAQSALIIPFSDDNTMFYIFTTEEVYGDFAFQMKLSIVDMKGDTARGEVVIKDIPILDCSTERLTASGFTGNPLVLAHEFGNNAFRAYQVTPDGVSNPVHSFSGEAHEFEDEPSATGYMKFGPTLGILAVVIPDSPNQVELFDFDFNNGDISNSVLIDINEPGSSIYGLEFSGNGQKLYVTTTGGTSKLLQYDLDSLYSQNPATDIEATKFQWVGTANFGALQMGPDGTIYLAVDGQNDVGSISAPDGDDLAANFQQQSGVTLAGRISRLGLPNFTQEVNQSPQIPGISTTIACAGQTTLFSGIGRDSSIETYQWDFGDGQNTGVLTSADTSHVYTTPGTYFVSLTLSNRCDVDTVLMDTLDVFSIPEEPMVPEDTALCGGSVTLQAWDVDRPDLNYYWSTGDTTRTVTFTSPAIVGVAIINDSGCSSDTLTVFIADNETFIDLGPDRLLCQYDTVVLDANVAGSEFEWTRNGVVVGDQRTQTVNTSTQGVFEYAVAFTNTFTGCVYRDTVELTIQRAPTVVQSNVVNPSCSASNGSFQLDIQSTGSFSYDLSGPVTDGPFTFDGPGLTPAFTGLPAGTYTSRVTNSVNGCTNTVVLQLENDAPFDVESVPLNDCARTSDISINILNTLPSQVDVNVYNASGFNVFSSTVNLTTRNIVVEDLDSGRYFIEVRDVNPPNCIQTDTVTLSVTDECFRKIFVPNAFSPNGNGQNEEFFAFPNQFVQDFKVYIYNRWGDIIYYSESKDFRWDGTYQGSIVSPGTYAYRMLFTSSLEPEAGTLEQYGSVTVVR